MKRSDAQLYQLFIPLFFNSNKLKQNEKKKNKKLFGDASEIARFVCEEVSVQRVRFSGKFSHEYIKSTFQLGFYHNSSFSCM